ncbi:MarR family winged helix-turn-helix transcriptional regulator [Amycolatopsis aidingensis]|uniref:MarR family winged helix-turn-helix transcriptional regulator n=1 Tax=Amycolatopsis aidingensis TaxID=2842453 RepID=UPI001C0E198A|nr:MarR family transcriptional regulator [Amycolatopsis aidingensis]
MPEPAAPGQEASAPEWLTQSVAPKLHRTAKASRTFFEQLLAEHGASFAMWTVLATLTMKGPMIQREIAAQLSIEGPTLTRHLETMEARGLVSRTRTDTDRRSSLVELTEVGRQLYERLAAVATEANEAMLSGVSPSDVQRFGRVLDRILANVARR